MENKLSEFDRKIIHGFLKHHIGDFMRYLESVGIDPAEAKFIIERLEEENNE